jgi:hypothetical protein
MADRFAAVFEHIQGRQGMVDPFPDLRRGDPQVFRSESHILFHDGADQLVVRVLKNHSHPLADFQQLLPVTGRGGETGNKNFA